MIGTLQDPFLGKRLRRRLPPSAAEQAQALLDRIEAARPELDRLAAAADANPPVIRTHDRWGDRLDEVAHHPAYGKLADWAYGELGLVAIAYDPAQRERFGGQPRTVAFAGGASFAMSEQGLYCPLCMTDGAARVLINASDAPRWQGYVSRLISRDSDRWSGAMFLTERQGGSDVGANVCEAVPEGPVWRLHGEKWFCSNAGADLALVLARPAGAVSGTRGLGLFAMPRVLEGGRRNHYLLRRAKDKLGTRSMCTAEVELNGAEAYLVGEADRGFVQMAEMINLSRLYNAVASIAIMSRSLVEARNWAHERTAFGKVLVGHPMVRETLDRMEAELDGSQALVWEVIGRLDRVEGGQGTDSDRKLIRLLTPLAKLYTARRAIWASSEAIEMLGGNGYVEEFITARLYRDAQVLPVWEGTTNIQTLDIFRAIAKANAAEPLFALLGQCLDAAPREVAEVAGRLREYVDELESALFGLRENQSEAWTIAAREWAFRMAPAAGAALMLAEAANAEKGEREELGFHADKLIDMHLEGWTAVGLLKALDKYRPHPREVGLEVESAR